MAELDNDHVRQAYARWAPVYDLAFTAVMRAGRRAAAAAASRASLTGTAAGRILDLGVGTGLELPMFDARAHVVGSDLSEPMLRRAQARGRADRLVQVDGLAAMDANRLGFADATFDAAIAPYVITVVPEPGRTLDELARVVKPGGEIVLVNHFGAEAGLLARIEAWLGRNSAALGWHPQFPFDVLGGWIADRKGLEMVERRPVPPFALFTLVRLRKAL